MADLSMQVGMVHWGDVPARLSQATVNYTDESRLMRNVVEVMLMLCDVVRHAQEENHKAPTCLICNDPLKIETKAPSLIIAQATTDADPKMRQCVSPVCPECAVHPFVLQRAVMKLRAMMPEITFTVVGDVAGHA